MMKGQSTCGQDRRRGIFVVRANSALKVGWKASLAARKVRFCPPPQQSLARAGWPASERAPVPLSVSDRFSACPNSWLELTRTVPPKTAPPGSTCPASIANTVSSIPHQVLLRETHFSALSKPRVIFPTLLYDVEAWATKAGGGGPTIAFFDVR
jgi:hypothetical protein